jgi:hypothetical protein
MLFLKIVAAHLANQKQGGVLLPGQVALCQFQNIVVVSAGQALVSRNHHKACFPLFLGLFMALDIPVLQVWGVAENIQDGLCQPVKIGLHLGELLAGLLHLCRRNKVHGVGDLQGLFHTPHAGADLRYACHVALTRFL